MLVIWRGWGIVVVGIAVLAFFLGGLTGEALGGGDRLVSSFAGLLLVPAGVGTWYLGRRMNRNMDRELVDPKTGQVVVVRNDHSLFFVRVEWWGPVMVLVGLVLFAAGIIGPSR